jgi:transcriptional regulator with XRE-family HTH domain
MKNKDKKRAKKSLLQDNALSSPESKAERLKRVRNLANLSREEFCADGCVKLATLISWEIGRFGGISRKGAVTVITRVAKEGVFVTPEWLLHEVGVGPEVQADYKKISKPKEKTRSVIKIPTEKNRMVEELLAFKNLNKYAIDYLVNDDTMLPHYHPGDYVAGTSRFDDKIKLLIGYDCIVQTKDGRIWVRHLQQGPRADSFNLVPTNLKTKTKHAIVYDVELASAAPIIWHRRKEPV